MVASLRTASVVRTRLFVTTALAAMAATQPAFASDGAVQGATYSKPEAYSGPPLTSVAPEAYSSGHVTSVAPEAYTTGVGAKVVPVEQIVIANPGTPTTARDTSGAGGVNGVGQMIADAGGGSLGLCTGTLINPRTVIFAAHCVNDNPASSYGRNSGGTAIGFGFAAENLPGVRQWFLPTIGGQPNPNQFRTNIANAFFNANQIMYSPVSLEPDAESFLYGDVALASLDTPAAKVPTWALLFSPLPATTITAAGGTGYHVTVTGYGNNGSAATGSTGGIDYRRRIAENIIGGLTSLDKFQQFLFGEAPGPLTQNLYFIDFDDPRRGLTGASPFDFNAFRDNAAGPNEGITASGDSGGPLIVDRAFAKPVVAGVLSGGYTRFFNGQPANGYGTVSFYQPLYLYWDFIAANNPYRYVTAAAGDGRWADPSRWVTTLDPNYQVITNGQLVNGIPTNPGEQKAGTSGQFGEICFQTSTSSECLNVATDTVRLGNGPVGSATNNAGRVEIGGVGNNAARVLLAGVTDDAAAVAFTSNDPEKQAVGDGGGTQGSRVLPAATLANGLPGATNFVPNNADGNRLTGLVGRYFDVTLGAAGTTTLDTVVTIDRFTMSNAAARLNITSAGGLTSLIDTTQIAGVTNVDGRLTTIGDYLILGGGLTGTGRINAAFTTNVTGTIAPATAGTIGTLTFGGNLVLASGSTLLIDLGAAGASDRVAVVANNFTTTPVAGLPIDGIANLGGRVAFGRATGQIVRNGDVFTILTAQGGTTGQFLSSSSALSAILTGNLEYQPGLGIVRARIVAGSYNNVVANTPVQRAYARLLDQNRGLAVSQFSSIYDLLDLESAGSIQATLEALAPRTETLKTSMAIAATDNTSRMIRDRLEIMEPGNLGGTMAYIGRPMQTAANALTAMPGTVNAVQSDMSGGGMTVSEGALPDTMSGFLAGGYLDGDSLPMATAIPGGGRDQFDGFYLAAGIEGELAEGAAAGIAFSYTDLDGTTTVAGQSASGQLYQGTVYGKANYGVINLDAQLSGGLFTVKTARTAAIVTNSFTLRGQDDALTASGEVGLSALFGGDTFKFGPRVAARATHIGFSRIAETGGGPALAIDRESYSSVQGRAGLVAKGTGTFRPFVTGTYVHDFSDNPTAFGANFVGGVGSNAIFALSGHDQDWFEVSGGIAIDTGPVVLSVAADTTIDREDVKNQSYRGSIKFRF